MTFKVQLYINHVYPLHRTVLAPPIVSLTSDTPSPILSGSNVTLTCTVELIQAVDVSVTVNTVWTGPATTNAPNFAVKESLTLYRSSHTLNFAESADSGEYTCTISIGNRVEMSARTSIKIGTVYT